LGFVQFGYGVSTSPTTTASVTLSGVSSANKLLCFVFFQENTPGGGGVACSDGSSGTYSAVAPTAGDAGAFAYVTYLFENTAPVGGSMTVTATPGASSSYSNINLWVVEWSGLGAFDAAATVTTGTSATPTSNSVTTAGADVVFSSWSTQGQGYAAAGGATQIDVEFFGIFGLQYKVVGSAGSYTQSCTQNSSSTFVGSVWAFSPAGGGSFALEDSSVPTWPWSEVVDAPRTPVPEEYAVFAAFHLDDSASPPAPSVLGDAPPQLVFSEDFSGELVPKDEVGAPAVVPPPPDPLPAYAPADDFGGVHLFDEGPALVVAPVDVFAAPQVQPEDFSGELTPLEEHAGPGPQTVDVVVVPAAPVDEVVPSQAVAGLDDATPPLAAASDAPAVVASPSPSEEGVPVAAAPLHVEEAGPAQVVVPEQGATPAPPPEEFVQASGATVGFDEAGQPSVATPDAGVVYPSTPASEDFAGVHLVDEGQVAVGGPLDVAVAAQPPIEDFAGAMPWEEASNPTQVVLEAPSQFATPAPEDLPSHPLEEGGSAVVPIAPDVVSMVLPATEDLPVVVFGLEEGGAVALAFDQGPASAVVFAWGAEERVLPAAPFFLEEASAASWPVVEVAAVVFPTWGEDFFGIVPVPPPVVGGPFTGVWCGFLFDSRFLRVVRDYESGWWSGRRHLDFFEERHRAFFEGDRRSLPGPRGEAWPGGGREEDEEELEDRWEGVSLVSRGHDDLVVGDPREERWDPGGWQDEDKVSEFYRLLDEEAEHGEEVRGYPDFVWFRSNTFLQLGQVYGELVTGRYAVVWARPGLYPQPPRGPGIWQPVNLAGYTLTMTVKNQVEDSDAQAIFQIDSASLGGITLLVAGIGTFKAQAPPLANATFADGVTRVVYDVRVKDPSANLFTADEGLIWVPPTVTRALT
jgi:hypothetical protein